MRLSGGQQQRVAIARAIASEADVLLADEPTGALDDENASIVLQTFTELAREDGRCVIVVTHSREVARRCDVELRLQRGRIRAQ
jgi:putative ABC transport system ATP-binding protein